MKRIIIFILFVSLASCKDRESHSSVPKDEKGTDIPIEYAKGFSLEKFDHYFLLKVNSPWPKAEQNFTYLLAEKDASLPEDLQFDAKVQIPVKKMVVTSTTHIPALEALNEEGTLKAFPGLDFISSPRTRRLIDSGKVKELGKNEALNTEVLIDLQPDVVVGFAIDGNNKSFETVQKTGIPVVYNGDWTETSPLGKAEWIKFFGAFYNKIDEATEVFNQIDSTYKESRELAKTAAEIPTVISGSMYKDQWYMPYGNSWQAKFIKDANAQYLYADTEGNGSMALSFESVLDKAQDADFWISAGQFSSYSQLLKESEHYRQFKAVEEKKVYSVSVTKGETGGTLYFELGPLRPDLVLKDLISIFHPELLPDYKQTFFKALKE